MKFGNERSPVLAEVINAAITQRLIDLHTMLPGRIEKYDPAEQKADIKPMLKRNVVLQDGTELSPESLPVIPNVPIMFPKGGGFFFSIPLEVGDFVSIVFCERSIDQYIAGSGIETDPIDLRMHSLSDAVAFPGLAPFSKALKDVVKDEMRLGQDKNGIQIHLKKDGVIDVVYANGHTLRLENKDENATLRLGDGAVHAMIAEAFASFWAIVKTNFDAHSNPNGGPPPIPFPAYDPNITSSKVSFPNG